MIRTGMTYVKAFGCGCGGIGDLWRQVLGAYTICSSTKARPCAVLDFHDPEIGIEPDLLVQPGRRPASSPQSPSGRAQTRSPLPSRAWLSTRHVAVQPRHG